jgi:hypothetical protein
MANFCKRCGRPTRSARAAETGYGEHCRRGVYRAARALEASGHPVAHRAAELLVAATLVPWKKGKVWKVAGKTAIYMTSATTCNCPGATYRPTANTCYHAVAVAVLAA